MIVFERFEDKKFEINTLADLDKLDNFTIEELKDENEYLYLKLQKEEDEKLKKEYSDLYSVISLIISNKNTPSKEELEKTKDEMFLPEYRKNGYFNSDEFKIIEKEVDDYISSLNEVTTQNYEILKQEILKNKYNINWLPYYKRFMPNVQVIVD